MSFKIDSLRLRTISDFQYDSPYVLDDVYEGVMVKGPIVYISGWLRQTIADNEEICILYLGPGESIENKFHGAVVGAENLVVNFSSGNARAERLGDDEIVQAPSGIALARPETV